MTATWEHRFVATERVVVGRGALQRLPSLCDELGMSRVVVVTGVSLRHRTPVVAAVEEALAERHVATYAQMREHAPEAAVEELAALLEATAADGVVGAGGGSPIDGAKAAVHRRDGGATRQVAIPTTLSAAEFTATAGYTDAATGAKTGVAGPGLAPRAVILDADLTLHTPERLWLSTGIRAVDHAVETVYAPEGDRFAVLIALEGLRRLLDALRRCHRDAGDVEARQDAQVAAWWSVLGLPSVTVAPSHGLGRVLGASFGIGHGITSCVLLPASIDHVAATAPDRVRPLCEPFGVGTPEEVGTACRAFIASLGLPVTLGQAGLDEAALERYLGMVPEPLRGVVRACW